MTGTFKKYVLLSFFLAGISIVLHSCIPRLESAYDVSDLKIEKKLNGTLIWFKAQKRIDGTEAFVSQSNWLIITIPHASIDLNKINSVQPSGIIGKIETERFESSVQISMKLTDKVGKVEVVRHPQTNDIYVNVLTPQENR
ncbi:MAG: hypothetical protein EHM64_01045 [Ignavibacteriae bacterium]|nr:MAG: hypothetical protein EHM64_01045 [Ignavibacteriota bacterium]